MKFEIFFPLETANISQHFGANIAYYQANFGTNGHCGTDFACPVDSTVRAAHDGIVTFAGEDGSGGIGIVIRTNDKRTYDLGEDCFYKTIYWHLSEVKVIPGQQVAVGDVIALSGNTGKSTGPHLHLGCKPVAQGEEDWQWLNLEQRNGFNGNIDPEHFFNFTFAHTAQLWQNLIVLLKQYIVSLKNKLNV